MWQRKPPSTSTSTELQTLGGTSRPSINYIWVGPPAADGKYKGHDIDGPIAMAQELQKQKKKNVVVFWCQKKHLTEYQQKLGKHGIYCRAIEDLLDVNSKSKDEDIRDATQSVQRLLTACSIPGRITKQPYRDKVTIKEMFSYYLAYLEGGYIFDTNIKPIPDHALQLENYERMHAPILYDEKKGQKKGKLTEVWGMFSPGNKNSDAKKAFQFYFDHWNKLEEAEIRNEVRSLQRNSIIYRKWEAKEDDDSSDEDHMGWYDSDDEEDHDHIGWDDSFGRRTFSIKYDKIEHEKIIDPSEDYFNALGKLVCDAMEKAYPSLWETQKIDSASYSVPALGVSKTYFNSHKYTNRIQDNEQTREEHKSTGPSPRGK